MNIIEVIKGARSLVESGVTVSRSTLFSNRGKEDLSKFPIRVGNTLIRAVNVTGGESSVLAKVRSSKKCNIYIQDLVLNDYSDIAKECVDDFENSETFCWVEEYSTGEGLRHFEITCISKTFCGARFAVCKDLMHILTDTVHGIKTANALLRCAMRWRSLIADEERDLDPETACFYYAIEVMLPGALRDVQFNAIRKKYKETSTCDLMVARSFMVPEKVIHHICEGGAKDQEIPYCGFSYQTNSDLNRNKGIKYKT